MKTLLLMRHAKSSFDGKVEDDRDRPLSKRGKKNAERIGELLKDEKIVPDLVMASSTLRARQTAEFVLDAIKYNGDICYLSKLYMAEVDGYVEEIQRIRDEVNTVLLIGHNPSLESLLQMVTGKVESLPTAAVANLAISIDSWKNFLADTHAEITNLWRPKDL
jgi:phosphohistidine phosphatase